MSNRAIQKRDSLQAKLLDLLQAHDDRYEIENSIRKETFIGDKDARIRVMGKDYTYAEVIGPMNVVSAGRARSAKATQHKKRHDYSIMIWYKWEDAELYENRSQKFWDDLLWDDANGVITALDNTSQLTDADSGNTYTLSFATEVVNTLTPMDSADRQDMAHFASFNIQLIDS